MQRFFYAIRQKGVDFFWNLRQHTFKKPLKITRCKKRQKESAMQKTRVVKTQNTGKIALGASALTYFSSLGRELKST